MRSPILLTLLAIGVTTPVLAQGTARQLVCPPQLSYCYYVEKPVLARPTTSDAYDSTVRTINCLKRQNDAIGNVDLHCERYMLPR